MRLDGDAYGGLVDPQFRGMSGIDRLAYFRRRIWERDGGRCGICGEAVTVESMHADHVIPRSLGGPDCFDNLRATHARCNIARGNGHVPRREPVDGEVVTYTAKLPKDVYLPLARISEREDRSLNQQIVRCLRECVSRYGLAPLSDTE